MPPYDETKSIDSTMIGKKDYGIKIAKSGFDIRFADDTDLLYNSSFPVLAIIRHIKTGDPFEIIKEGYEKNSSGVDTWVYSRKYEHKADYVPLIIDYFNHKDLLLDFNHVYDYYWDNRYVYVVDTFYIQADYNAFIANNKPMYTLSVLAVNIEHDIEYPYFDTGIEPEWGLSDDYGIKYIKNGDIHNLELNDLGINPNIQSLMAIAVKVTSDSNKIYYEPRGIPFSKLSVLCCVKNGDVWRRGDISVQSAAGVKITRYGNDEGYYTIDGLLFADSVSIIVVRLPFIAPTQVSLSVDM